MDPAPDPSEEEKAMNRRRLRIIVAALATVALLLGVAAAAAHGPRWRRPPPISRAPSFSLSLEDASGRSLSTFSHQGGTWVLGEEGERYVIVVRNPTSERVEAVVSVDGRDVLSGQVANFNRHRGYIVPAFGSVRIEGFRQSLDTVAAFRFTDPGNSYSSRMGTPENVGVIGVAFFSERVREQAFAVPDDDWRFERRRPAPKRKAAAPSAGAAGRSRDRAAESDSNIGTEYGESRTSRVVQVSFERASSTPARVLTLRYDDADGLEARGIDVFRRFRHTRPPRPFPQPFAQGGFAPPPP